MKGTIRELILLPCPFCASVDIDMLSDKDEAYVHCYNCQALGPVEKDEVMATELWNSRADFSGLAGAEGK